MLGGAVAGLHASQARCFFETSTEACVKSDMVMISGMVAQALINGEYVTDLV
jgi:hypothetical protein